MTLHPLSCTAKETEAGVAKGLPGVAHQGGRCLALRLLGSRQGLLLLRPGCLL